MLSCLSLFSTNALLEIILQDDSQTLNDKQIDKVMARLMDNFEKRIGAKQR